MRGVKSCTCPSWVVADGWHYPQCAKEGWRYWRNRALLAEAQLKQEVKHG